MAANPQPKSQKLLWRLRATPRDRDFFTGRSEGHKRELGVRAAARDLLRPCAPTGAASIQTF
jgi:hypothetical protein